MKILLPLLLLWSNLVIAIENPAVIQKAKSLHIALTGVLPVKADLYRTVEFLKLKKQAEAANYIIQNDPAFYNVMLKNLVTPWTNKGANASAPLNDMSALMIGFIRDDLPFNEIFFQDMLYIFKGTAIGSELHINSPGPVLASETDLNCTGSNRFFCSQNDQYRYVVPDEDRGVLGGRVVHYIEYQDWLYPTKSESNFAALMTSKERLDFLKTSFPSNDRLILFDKRYPETRYVINKYKRNSNSHYANAERLGLNLKDPSIFVKVKQSDYLHSDERAIAGILSTRQFGDSYLKAGTNRAALSFTVSHFLCTSIEQLKDNTLSDEFIRKDIARIPGGIEATFKNNCSSCHTGMDPLANAFSYHNFANERLEYTFNVPTPKLNSNISNDDPEIGHLVESDRWVNFWKTGLHSRLGWGPVTEGYGINSLGRMLSTTTAFSSCMSKRVYEKVCLKNIRTADDGETKKIAENAKKFETQGFNMKTLIVETSLSCKELQ